MSRHKKDKKLKKKEKLQAIVEEEQQKFDVIELLRVERQDSKPNLGKFLSEYVKEIRGCNGGKISFYPTFHYDISKVFVRFLDGHELIYCKIGIKGPEYYLYDGCTELELKAKEVELVKQFFDYLEQFKFIY